MPSTCAPIIGNTSDWRVMVVLDHHVAGQVHHRDHHAEAGQRGEHRGPHAGAAQDLRRAARRAAPGPSSRRRRRSAPRSASGPGRTSSTSTSAIRLIAAGRQPRHGQRRGVDLAAREQRPEHRGPEDRAEHRAEQHVGDPARAALRRVHVARRRADQQRDPVRRAGQREAGDHDRRRAEVRGERGQRAADGGAARSRRRSPAGARCGPSAARRAPPPAPRPSRKIAGPSPSRPVDAR